MLLAALLLTPGIAGGQAWTPAAGEGTVWLSGQTLHSTAHLQGNGVTAPDIDVKANTATLGFDYGLTDRLALSMNLPYVSARFRDGEPHVGSTVDDGRTHQTITDLRIELRYKAIDSVVVFTPVISAVIPMSDYETLGHAAASRGMMEYAAGFELGYNAVPISPSLFLSGGYRFSNVERIDDHITVDRSNVDFYLDYILSDRVGLRASAMWQKTHGGLDLPLPVEERAEHGHHHDQLARANFWHASVGMSYALTSTLELFGSWSTVLEGINSHQFDAWGGGIAWRFDRSRTPRRTPVAGELGTRD